MTNDHAHSISRRNFLKGSFVYLSSAILGKYFPKLAPFFSSALSVQKRIYLAPDDHTDYFWSAGEDVYRQAFLDTLDYYLNLADMTATNPPEYQSRWNCDGSLWMWTYERNKPLADFERLVDRIKSGHISVPLNALCVCLGGAPTEAVLRGMYYPGQIERRYNLRFNLAYLMENQTLPLGVVSLFAGSGARYSWKGICGCDTQVTNAGDREHDIYWWVGLDGSRLLMKWNSMLGDMPGLPGQSSQGMGGYAEARYPAAVVDYVDSDADFVARYPYQIIGAFGKGWDDIETMTDEFVSVAQNKSDATRQVIVSNEEDFFKDFETTYGNSIPSKSVSFGNEWDLYCANLSEVSARIKRSIEKLRGAEALATFVSLKSNVLNGREGPRDQAWMDFGLFWEHDFGMANPPSGLVQERIAWQKRLAVEIESYVNNLAQDATIALGNLIQSSGSNFRFYVFNPLNWSRTDYADIPYANTSSFHVIDLSTNQEVPSQIVMVNGERRLRILAENVPSVGYKVFEVRPDTGQNFTDAASVNGNILENQYYKLTLADRGAITSLIDKARRNREFVRSAMNDLGPSAGTLQVENLGPVTVTLLATATSPLAHTTRITLIRNSNRIEIHNEINQNFDSTYSWDYGFELNNPDVWHEEVGAILRAKLNNQGGHYSPRNARYDWLTLNHFADINDGSVGMTLSNADCYFMKLGNSTPDNLDTSTPRIAPLVGGRVVSTYGLPNQGGDTYFLQRFALCSHDVYNPVNALKFSLEHQNKLITGQVSGGNAYPEKSYSLLEITNPNVLLWALKPADDGMDQGIVIRLWNVLGNEQAFTLSMAVGQFQGARQLTHIETPLKDATVVNGALTDKIAGNQLKTYSVSLTDWAPIPTPAPPGANRVYLPYIENGNASLKSAPKYKFSWSKQ